MKNLFTIFMLAMLGMAVTFTSCKKDDDDDDNSTGGTAVVGGNTATFTKGALEYYGAWGDAHNFDIYLASSNVNFVEETGTGNLLYFELFTNSNTFNGGTFTYNAYEETAGTFDYADLIINGNWATETADHYYSATGGTITVTKSGSTYDIVYNLTVQEYDLTSFQPIGGTETMSGTYSGALTYYDYSDSKISKEKNKFSIRK